MSWSGPAYRGATYLARGLLSVASLGSTRVREGITGRRASAASFADWARTTRDRDRPLVLWHAPSAGELRQLEPVIRRLRQHHPEWQLAVTCTSPSGPAVAHAFDPDIAGLLPFDLPGPVDRLFDALKPAAVVVGKLDLWPCFADGAERRGIPVALVAATVRARSGRLSWPARKVLQPAYASLALAAAVTDADADRLARLGVSPEKIHVLGDPRYDAVVERLAHHPAPVHRDPNALIAGSTWPEDDRILLTAFRRVLVALPWARLVLVPHRPDRASAARLEALATRLDLPPPRRSPEASDDASLIIVDEVGSLAFRYGSGGIAYVGGGFRRSGVHSVLEPAACGIPIVVGPRAEGHPEVERLAAAGGLERLPRSRPAEALADHWLRWLEDPAARTAAGQGAGAAVHSALGAADRIARVVERLVEESPEYPRTTALPRPRR